MIWMWAGLRAKSEDLLINTQLYTNRAASQYRIGNYRCVVVFFLYYH